MRNTHTASVTAWQCNRYSPLSTKWNKHFLLKSICSLRGNNLRFNHLNETRASIWRRTSLLVSNGKARRWWKSMGAKNVRGNVKSLACVSVRLGYVHSYTSRNVRAELPCGPFSLKNMFGILVQNVAEAAPVWFQYNLKSAMKGGVWLWDWGAPAQLRRT